MLAFFIFMAWLSMELIDVYMPPGKHTVGNSNVITQHLNSSWPIYNLDNDQFFVAYKLKAGQGAPEGVAGNEDQYFSGIWLQRKNGKYADHFKGIPCQENWDPMNVTLMFSQNIQGYTCPNMNTTDNTGKKKITLQNPSEANYNKDHSDFFFVIDTCASLTGATGATNCKTEEESQAVLENMYVEIKI